MSNYENDEEAVEENVDDQSVDPFSPDNIGVVQFIMFARLYDVGMALLSQLDAAVASELLELHSNGALMGPSPMFVGTFATDELNQDDLNQDTGENL